MALQYQNKTLTDVVESDVKTVKFFSITYKAKIQLKGELHPKERSIVQNGFYQTLDPAIKSEIKGKTVSTIKIRYNINDPVWIEFLLKEKIIPFPTLITKAIDDQWSKDKMKNNNQ